MLPSLWNAVSTAMDGAAPTWKVALGLLVLMGESFLGSKEGSVINEIRRHPVREDQAGKCKLLQTCTPAA